MAPHCENSDNGYCMDLVLQNADNTEQYNQYGYGMEWLKASRFVVKTAEREQTGEF